MNSFPFHREVRLSEGRSEGGGRQLLNLETEKICGILKGKLHENKNFCLRHRKSNL